MAVIQAKHLLHHKKVHLGSLLRFVCPLLCSFLVGCLSTHFFFSPNGSIDGVALALLRGQSSTTTLSSTTSTEHQLQELQEQVKVLQSQPRTMTNDPLALAIRATKHAGCDPPLTCAWSLDGPRTQVVSKRLHHLVTAGTMTDQDGKPASGAAPGSAVDWDETHYDDLNQRYESNDPTLTSESVGIVKLNLPESVHVIPMGGEAYFRRSLRDADLVLDGFLRGGRPTVPQPNEKWLDFGGSHGRVTQIMRAAFPQTEWYVADPIQETSDWARQQFKTIQFTVSQQKPPIPGYSDNMFTGIYAISIWSHYSEPAALAWFEEMHRILQPNGKLWFSTHGYQAINFAALEGAAVHTLRPEVMHDLYVNGHYYYPMFGTQGDWGVNDGTSDGSWWGYCAFTTEWLAAKVLNRPGSLWQLEYFGPGANERHQDVYVISKVVATAADTANTATARR